MSSLNYRESVEKWGVFEVAANGRTDGNPFVDFHIQGTFTHRNETRHIDGFYDGDGVYTVRFMPSYEGLYTYEISGSFSSEKTTGSFEATAPTGNNHGLVRVANKYHFAYEDATPYYPVGTTCYVWTHQSQTLQEQTLETLKNSAFNKIRFCIFPKHYDFNFHDPITFPYEGTPVDNSAITRANFSSFGGYAQGNDWDFHRFNPLHFQLFEKRIQDLMELGIEADLIVMHPYDRWGFSEMDAECDDLYWHYVVARFSAYRNVWWSLANEYDLMRKKKLADWERYASILCNKDPYGHLRSIHNCRPFYDYTRPWITHCCIQRQDAYKCAELTGNYREQFGKPIVLDEIAYEGNVQHGWGNISGKELVRRFWEATCRGGYAGHGETYMHPDDILWWSHGGTLHGDSPERLKFLAGRLQESPGIGLTPVPCRWDEVAAAADAAFTSFSKVHDCYLYYFGFNRPSFRTFHFDDETLYEVELIDTWEMTIEKAGTFKGPFRVDMPGKEYMAVRMRKSAQQG